MAPGPPAVIYEVQNATCAQDVAAVFANTQGQTSCSSGPLTTTTANDLLIGVCGLWPWQSSVSPGSGWSSARTFNGSSGIAGIGEVKVASTPGGYTATSGTFSPSGEQGTLEVAFKASTGGGTITNPSLTLYGAPDPSIYGQAVMFTATISNGPSSGTISFFDSNNVIGTGEISGNQAILSISMLTVGSHTISASFAGDSNYGSATSPAVTQTVNSALLAYTYTAGFDAVGNVTSYADSVNGNWTFTYDALNRLRTGAPAPTPPLLLTSVYCWTYDSFGNRTAEVLIFSSPCYTPHGGPPPTAAYNSKNQVTWTTVNVATNGFVYDAAGNVTNDNVNTYLYDPEGRICAVKNVPVGGISTMVGYLYDAEGNRIARGTISNWGTCDISANGFTVTAVYILGPSGEQVTELNQGASGLAWTHTNVFQGGSPFATYDSSGLHYYVNDPLGTRRVQTTYTGAIEQSCTNLPFGNSLSCTGSTQVPTEHHYTGKERDSESGNDYFGARYYASSMGRWLSPDWSAKIVPVPYAKLDNPQSLNLYAYVGNNPLTRFDPDGHVVPDSCAKDKKCSITVKINVILDQNAKSLTKADWKAFQKDFLAKAQKDFGKSNIKLDYTYTNGSLSSDGSSGTGMKSGFLNFFVTDKNFAGPDGGSKTSPEGLAESYIDIKGLGEGGGPNSTNWTSVIVPLIADSNVFEHELGQQFLGTRSPATRLENLWRQDKIDNENTFQGWGVRSNPYRTGLEPASFAAPTDPQQ